MITKLILLVCLCTTRVSAFTPNSDVPFSLSAYQKARAEETSQFLDASRFHFQILLVDKDNFHGRIAEGILARVVEYNDALFTLFPSSATIASSPKAPLDAAAPDLAVTICENLGLCSTRSTAMGTSFDMSYLDEYDLILAMDDEIQSLILRSLPAEKKGYEPKCRLLSEFLGEDFCNIWRNQIQKKSEGLLLEMLEPDLYERVEPYYELLRDSSSNVFAESNPTWKSIFEPCMVMSQEGAAVPNVNGWPVVEAAMIMASAGLTRFCLDTMDTQFDSAFQSLLNMHFCRVEHLDYSFEEADVQLCKGSSSITGYFSPEQRKKRFEQHIANLRLRIL